MNKIKPFQKLIVKLIAVFLLPMPAFAQPAKVLLVEKGLIFDTVPFKSCHASTIVQLSNGTLMAAWFGGEEEGSPDVSIWTAVKKDSGWTTPIKTADGIQPDGKQFACWNPVLFKAKDGTLYLHYKVGPNPREWWAMYKLSTDDGNTWSAAKPLPDGFLGPIKDKPLQLLDGHILYPSSVESRDEQWWTIHIEQSDEKLQQWQKINIDCDTFQVIQPTLLTYPHNKLQLLARSKQNVIVQGWSDDNGHTWSRLTKTALPNPNSGIDAVTVNNQLQVLVYNPLRAGQDWWEGRSVLKLAISTDGEHWQDIYSFEHEQKGEFSYPAIIADTSGNLYVTYTYNRANIKFVHLRIAETK
ncbi:sialidase [Ilyomonas limi]|uniref:Sialidase n=1 Tax=Ilyomonas limi TaxID=2575867 RepID=A0A4V6XAR2_9BACT|nr:sialidase family protein [Ilyomonas limi]TKK64153.1 sialidase [Ilyomonas limi]